MPLPELEPETAETDRMTSISVREVGTTQSADCVSAPTDGTVAEFISTLRAWKIRAGNPSFQELQRRTGIPRSTLADALNPQRLALPRWEVVAALVQTLAGSPEESVRWRHAWTVLQLETVEQAALTGSLVGAGRAAPAGAGRILPRQLPPAIDHFTGRTEPLDRLEELSTRAARGSGPRGAAIAAVINGPFGVGKTALALQWAHSVADRFPDGQLHLDMCGSQPSGIEPGPLTSIQALRTLLTGLLTHGEHLPDDPTALLALYRSRLAGTRTLLFLDDAVDAEQVRPLLPGSSHCMVIVTSRSPLAGLIALNGAETVTLGPLTEQEAHTLVARRLGTARDTLSHRTAAALIDLSGRSPLALNQLIARALLLKEPSFKERHAQLNTDPAFQRTYEKWPSERPRPVTP